MLPPLLLFASWPGPLAVLIALPASSTAPSWCVSDGTSAVTNRAWRRFVAPDFFASFLTTLLLIIEWSNA
ncbi:hypothetical protein GCM10011490_04310 [Pseudoclavibacter endophyticus]|nr:hypothetical protein GCM10011490_04310 [Pseudoclavibacter endophyticus]